MTPKDTINWEARTRRRLGARRSLHRVPKRNQPRMGTHLIRNQQGRMILKGNMIDIERMLSAEDLETVELKLQAA